MYFERIKDIREDKDLTQKDLAKLLNIKQPTYNAFEKGTKIIPLKHLNTLCNFYKVSMDYILGLSNNRDTFKNDFVLNKLIIGNNIKIFRKDNNLTLRSLAKELNTSSSTISAYETGKTLILTAFAYQICKNYNISMDWLCGRKNAK